MALSPLARATRFLTVSDPGRLRLRSATSVTLSVILATVALLTFVHVADQPLTVAMLGTIVAMQSATAVKDRQQSSRVITTLLLFLPAMGAVTLAAILSGFGNVGDVGFVAVLFAAVWVRRYGPRGNALGMIAFISYFFALFIHAKPHQLPILALAVAIGLAATLFVRALVLPDRPRVEVRRLVRALRAASLSVLETASNRKDRDVELLRRRLGRLGQTGMMIDDWLDRHNAAQLLNVTNEDLSFRVFDAQIATEQLVSALWALDPQKPWPPGLGRATTALGSCLQDHPSEEQLRAARKIAAAAADKADATTPTGIATIAAQRAAQAHIAIHHITTHAIRTEAPPPAPVQPGPEKEPQPGLDPSTKAAIQVAVATSAATILGELISPDRWYWAVLTAFIVFTGASSRGEILTRAGHRIVGTVAGVVAGVGLAALVGDNRPVQIALLLICVFCAAYLVTVAYALLTFFVTVLLAMLYGLLGEFSIDVLQLRIAETVAGGAVGMAAAFFIFSTGTRSTLIDKVDDYLDRMLAVIDEGVGSVLAPGGHTELVAHTRELDKALSAVLVAGKPLELRPTSRGRRGAKRLLRVLQISNRSAHALARAGVNASRADGDDPPSAETAKALQQAADTARLTVGAVRSVVHGEQVEPPEKISQTMILDVMRTSSGTRGPVRGAVRSLNNLQRALGEATTRL